MATPADTTFDAAFGAGKASIQKSAKIPLSSYSAQATIAQATTINAGNAALAAIESNRAVQEKYANNADTIKIEATKAANTTAVDVAEIALKGIQAVQLGRDGLVQESVAAMQAQKELSAVQADKPNALLHPVRWIADTLHANKLEDTIKEHSIAVQNYTRSINAVVQNTSVQVDELLSLSNLTNSASLQARAAELNKGLAAEQVNATAQTEGATKLREIGNDIFSEAQAHANWAINDLNSRTAAQNAENGKRSNELQAQDLQLKLDAVKHRDGAIKQAAMFYLTQQNDGKGLPPTQANINMAIEHMDALQRAGSPEFALWSKGGAFAINSSDPKTARTAAVQGMTVGEIAQLGAITKNGDLSAIGGAQVNQLTSENEVRLKREAFMATLPAGKEFTQAAYDLWEGGLKAPQNSDFKKRSRAIAENIVYNQSAKSYLDGRTANKDVGQGAINLVAFKNPATLVSIYKIPQDAARVLADPKVQLYISHAAAGATADKKTAQLIAIMDALDKNGIKNSAGIAALIGQATGRAALNTDTETATLADHGIVTSGSGVINYKGKPYRLGNAVDLERMRIAVNKKDDTFFSKTGGHLGKLATEKARLDAKAMQNAKDAVVTAKDFAVGMGVTFLKDVVGIKERNPLGEDALAKTQRETRNAIFGRNDQYTPEQAALEASQYTPAGHAPQVAGSVPATALTEAEKLQNLQDMLRPLAARHARSTGGREVKGRSSGGRTGRTSQEMSDLVDSLYE